MRLPWNKSRQPEDKAAFHLREGLAQDQRGHYAEALRCYATALEINPGLGDAHFNRAVVLRKLGDYREAVDALSAAIAANESDWQALWNLGLNLDDLGEREPAQRAYIKFIGVFSCRHALRREDLSGHEGDVYHAFKRILQLEAADTAKAEALIGGGEGWQRRTPRFSYVFAWPSRSDAASCAESFAGRLFSRANEFHWGEEASVTVAHTLGDPKRHWVHVWVNTDHNDIYRGEAFRNLIGTLGCEPPEERLPMWLYVFRAREIRGAMEQLGIVRIVSGPRIAPGERPK